MNGRFIVTAIMFLHLGCTSAQPPDETQIRAAIAGQLKDIEAMTNYGHTPEKASALYLEYLSVNPTVLPYGGQLLQGEGAVSDFYGDVFSSGTLISNSYTDPTIDLFDGFAVRIYEGTAEFRLTGSEESFAYTNVYTDILVQEKGEWKIQWHSWVPAPGD